MLDLLRLTIDPGVFYPIYLSEFFRVSPFKKPCGRLPRLFGVPGNVYDVAQLADGFGLFYSIKELKKLTRLCFPATLHPIKKSDV